MRCLKVVCRNFSIFYNLHMTFTDTFQDTSGCRDGPQDRRRQLAQCKNRASLNQFSTRESKQTKNPQSHERTDERTTEKKKAAKRGDDRKKRSETQVLSIDDKCNERLRACAHLHEYEILCGHKFTRNGLAKTPPPSNA